MCIWQSRCGCAHHDACSWHCLLGFVDEINAVVLLGIALDVFGKDAIVHGIVCLDLWMSALDVLGVMDYL